jgi:hypothetical protein
VAPVSPRGSGAGGSSTSTSCANLKDVMEQSSDKKEITFSVQSPNAAPYELFLLFLSLFVCFLSPRLMFSVAEWSVEEVANHFASDNVLKKFVQSVIENDIDGQILILLRYAEAVAASALQFSLYIFLVIWVSELVLLCFHFILYPSFLFYKNILPLHCSVFSLLVRTKWMRCNSLLARKRRLPR